MLYRAYLDESDVQGIFAVAGFVGKAVAWDSLEQKWLSSLPNGIPYFHATDCFGGHNDFEGMDIPERVKLLDRLTDLILQHEISLVAGTILIPTYKELASKRLANEFGGNQYSSAFEFAIELACHSMDNSPLPRDIGEQCAFVMERNQYTPSAQRKFLDLQKNEALWWRNRIGTDTYGTKAGSGAVPLLQVADLGAFLAAKVVAKAAQGKIQWWPYLQKLTNGKRVFGITHCDDKSLRIMHVVHRALKNGIEDFIAGIDQEFTKDL
jgi:hypothetical protein